MRAVTRRSFIGCCTCLAATVGVAESPPDSSDTAPASRLYDPLTAEEEEHLNSSPMVEQIRKIQGCSCAESVFLAALRHLKQPEAMLSAAASFGGGMGHQDLCGLLTGGFMALGVAAGVACDDPKKKKTLARNMTNEFWEWWQMMAPLHCRELKPNYEKAAYPIMLSRVAAKIEELITKHSSTAQTG
jgi:C_GCAxxG_C_C family probable redox protein